MIAVIDLGIGNIGSVVNMLRVISAEAMVATTPEDLVKAKKIILPGIGKFDVGIEKIDSLGLRDVLVEKILIEKIPALGICLGMHMLGNASAEGSLRGLGLIEGECVSFLSHKNLKKRVPHMRWNQVVSSDSCVLFDGLEKDNKFYFTHSYHFMCKREDDIVGMTDYGIEFVSAINRENIFGVQFHPEKSHRFGKQLLENFRDL